jgi:hypothetical protein
MDIHNLEQIKQEFSDFQQEFETGNKEKALEKLLELLDALEEADTSRRAAQIDKDGNVTLSSEIPAGKPAAEKSAEDGTGESQPLYMSLNHVMEYYIFAYYFQPATEVRCTAHTDSLHFLCRSTMGQKRHMSVRLRGIRSIWTPIWDWQRCISIRISGKNI